MIEVIVGYAIPIGEIIKSRLICSNEECEYYGIPRMDLRKEKWRNV